MSKIIGLDCGHSLKTAGKQTPDGIKEWVLNDKVRDKVVNILKEYDCEIINTDNDEGNIDEGLTERRVMYVNKKVDAFVSIHHNALTGQWNDATGVEIYTDKNPTSKDIELANAIYKNLPNYTGLKARGIKQANFTVINQNQIPAVLVEGGFMDSNNDYKVITSNEGQEGYAKAIAEGLIEFLGLKVKEKSNISQQTNNVSSYSYKDFVKDVQRATGAKVDGIAGSETLSKTITVSKNKNRKHAVVKPIQKYLYTLGYTEVGVADGIAGIKFDAGVKHFQRDNSCVVDGEITARNKTWKKLLKLA